MKYILETKRLRLREFTLEDTKFILELLNSPGWIEFIGDRNVRNEEQATNYLLNGPMESYTKHGFGLSMVERKADNTPVGMCGILKREKLENPDIGFAFLPAFTGLGYAFEIASATLNYSKTTLHIPRMSAITVAGNTRSINLLTKLGFKFEKNIRFGNPPEDLLLFSEADQKL